MRQRIKAVIFDMDGVIIDSEPVYNNWLERFLSVNGIQVTEEELCRMVGISSQDYRRTLEKWWVSAGKKIPMGEDVYEIFNLFCADYPFSAKEIMNPQLREVVGCLKMKGLKIALASSSSLKEIKKVMEEIELEPWFDVIMSGADLKESKPNPEIYIRTLEELGMMPEECLAVEDSSYGIQAAQAAGIPVAAIRDERFGFDQSSADFLISRLNEILDIIQHN